MKRNFTYFAALVLSLLMATPMLADELSLIGVGTVETHPTEGQYYVIQGNGQAGQVTWLYDNNGTLAATEASEAPTGPDGIPYVWTFEISSDGQYAAKNLVTGNYIFIEGTSNGGSVKMQKDPTYFSIEVDGDNVAFKNASGQYIDMSYSGIKPSTWAGGVAGSRRLNIYVAQVAGVDDYTIAKGRLESCFAQYEQYLPNYGDQTFDKGTEVGQYNYNEDDYNLFVNNLQLAFDILTGEVTGVTTEQIYEIIEKIETGYNAIIGSLVPLTIADGNYRIVSALEWTNTTRVNTGEVDGNGDPVFQDVTIHPLKAMYATMEGKAMWADIDSTDCRYLWKMTNNAETGLIQMMNIATDGILATCSQSAQATLAADSQTEMKFEFIRCTEEGKIVVVMKPSTGGSYAYLHTNNHSGGAGTASNIVGWTSEAGASQWILEPVTDEEVAELVDLFAPIKDHEMLVSMFQGLIDEAEDAIGLAKDESYITERSAGLIGLTSQFSSPFTDPEEGSFDNVLNEETSSFWHSTWHEGDKQNHDHYFQVSFNTAVKDTIQCRMIRRNVANDHITNLGVFGTNDDAILGSTSEDEWTNLGSFDLSQNASSGQSVYSNFITIDNTDGYKYLRFYIDGTTTGRGYGHFAFFQLYNLSIDGNTQWSKMGKPADDIDTALTHAKTINQDELTIEDYNALKAALDAFKAVLVDPSALAQAIAANKDVVSLVAIGDNPGFWSAGSDVSALASILKEATAYLKGGVFTQAKVDEYAEAINSSVSDVFATANPVEPDKWYALKFDSEKNYDAHNWSKAGAINDTLGDLFGNYAAPANIETDGEGDEQTQLLVGLDALDEVTIGQAVRFINEDVITQMDQIAFRFVAQGDSAFAIQHKSGLYLAGAARSTNLTLGLTPALFNVKAVGYGKVVIEARDLKGQGYYTEPVYLHGQNSGHSLVTWNNDNVASSSALYIEPIEDNDFDEGTDVAESTMMNAKPNSIVFMCYPTGFSVEGAEIYAYQGAIKEGTTAHYAFNKIEQAEPGQPVLLVVGNPENFKEDDPADVEEPEEIYITPLSSSFAVDPLTTGGVHGTYAYQWVDEGTVVVGGGQLGQPGNTLVLAEGAEGTDCTRDVSANTGYIVYGENILNDASANDFDLVFTADRPMIKGDVNDDSAVDIADAVAVLNAMAGHEVSGNADTNGDDVVDIADAVKVLSIMAGN